MTEARAAPPSACLACRRPAEAGALCVRCADRLGGPRLVPEQIESSAGRPLDAALVDRFGQVHPLGVNTAVGRRVRGDRICIRERSVSKRHAEIERGSAQEECLVRDLASASGTFLEGEPVRGDAALFHGCQVRFGGVAFYFVTGAGAALRGPRQPLEIETLEVAGSEPSSALCGLQLARLQIFEVAAGGGLLAVGDRTVELPAPQLQLVRLLTDRMRLERGKTPLVRGFISSAELLRRLPWRAPRPGEKHLQDLVRRTRRTLADIGLEGALESRRSLGYRLRILPL